MERPAAPEGVLQRAHPRPWALAPVRRVPRAPRLPLPPPLPLLLPLLAALPTLPARLILCCAGASTGSGKTTELARIALMLLDEYLTQGYEGGSADFRQPFPLQIAGSVGTAAANLGAPTLHGLLGWRPLPDNLEGDVLPEPSVP